MCTVLIKIFVFRKYCQRLNSALVVVSLFLTLILKAMLIIRWGIEEGKHSAELFVSTAKTCLRNFKWQAGKETDSRWTFYCSDILLKKLYCQFCNWDYLSFCRTNIMFSFLFIEMDRMSYPEVAYLDIQISSKYHKFTPPTCVGVWKCALVTQL